jgi:hypothetical protein
MVRFQVRWIKKSYKGKNRHYRVCSVNFPVFLHDKGEAKAKKDYDVAWNEQETDQLETVTVTFTRNKLPEDPST